MTVDWNLLLGHFVHIDIICLTVHQRARARARTHTHTHTRARARVHTHTRTHARTHAHTHTHTHTHNPLQPSPPPPHFASPTFVLPSSVLYPSSPFSFVRSTALKSVSFFERLIKPGLHHFAQLIRCWLFPVSIFASSYALMNCLNEKTHSGSILTVDDVALTHFHKTLRLTRRSH